MAPLNPSPISNNTYAYYIETRHAYTSLGLCVNLTLLLSHFTAVAAFAPAIGLVAGCGTIYLFTKGVR